MRTSSYQQFAIVQGTSAQDLSDQLNEKLKELRYKFPKVDFEGLIARISYTEHVPVPETLADEYELAGFKLTCEQCPLFKPILNKDGTENKRVKYGDCPYRDLGRTYRTTRMCDMVYEMIEEGKVKLCLSE